MRERSMTYQARIIDLIEQREGQEVLVINNTDLLFPEELKRLKMVVELKRNNDKILKKYDCVILFGLFYEENDSWCLDEMMHVLLNALKERGQLLWCIDNKFGLKYWSGTQYEEGGFFRTLEAEDKERLNVISHHEIIKLLQSIRTDNTMVYYPYPDYRYPISIYSDEWLPQVGDLENYDYNFELFRYRFFDEGKVWDNIISEGLFEEFANSFIVKIEGC